MNRLTTFYWTTLQLDPGASGSWQYAAQRLQRFFALLAGECPDREHVLVKHATIGTRTLLSPEEYQAGGTPLVTFNESPARWRDAEGAPILARPGMYFFLDVVNVTPWKLSVPIALLSDIDVDVAGGDQ